MVKQIKVIKCPQCGSVTKTEIKPDHYRCNSCETEYFLDNDDINININHANTSKTPVLLTPKLVLLFGGVLIIIAILIYVLAVGSKEQPPSPTMHNSVIQPKPISQSATTALNQTAVTQPIQKQYRTQYQYCFVQTDSNRVYQMSLQSQLALTGNKSYYQFVVYNLLDNKIINTYPLDEININSNDRWQYLDYSPTKSYFVLNNRRVFMLDKSNYRFTEVTNMLLVNHPEYQTGIASITTSITTSGNALHILTNDGKKAYYYPIIDKIYADDNDFHMLKNRPPRPPEDHSEHTVFGFAHYYQQDYKLIKATYINPFNGENNLEFRSSKPGNYVLTIGVNEQKTHTSPDDAYDILNRSNLNITLVNHKNLTPGRLYFDPSILYFDDEDLIIKTKVNAAPDAIYNYQRIDVNSGKLLWNIGDDKITIKEITPFNHQLITKAACNNYSVIDDKGKIIKQIQLDKE